jgi:predicted nucleotidyltransferase
MGTIPDANHEIGRGRVSLADALFTATQQRVLGALFGQPSRAFYANELIGLTRGGTGAIQREIKRLADSGLVTVRSVGNQKHYQANPDAPIFAELCAIAQKTFAIREPLREALSPVAAGIRAAFVFGSIAKRQDTAGSDIDLMVISDTVSYPELYDILENVRSRLGRPLNVTILTSAEVASRRKRQDSFLTRVLAQPKIWIIGSDHVLDQR